MLVQVLIQLQRKEDDSKKLGLHLAVCTLAVPTVTVACLLWFITIHHFIMLYGAPHDTTTRFQKIYAESCQVAPLVPSRHAHRALMPEVTV